MPAEWIVLPTTFSIFYPVQFHLSNYYNVVRIRMENSVDPDQLTSELDKHCFQTESISRFSRTRLKCKNSNQDTNKCPTPILCMIICIIFKAKWTWNLAKFLFGLPWIQKMSQCMRFPTMWYVRPAKPQISLRICAVWSEPC